MAKLSMANFESNATLLYGRPGTGKTTSISELANAGYTLHLIDLEGGADTLLVSVKPENYNNVNVYRVWDDSQNAAGIKIVSRVLNNKGAVAFCKEHSVIGCGTCKDVKDGFEVLDVAEFGAKDILVIDSITQLINSACVHSAGARQVLQTKKLEWDNWSDIGQLMDFIFSKAQAAKFKTVFITHEMLIDVEGVEKIILPIGGTKEYSKNFSRFFANVIRHSVKNGTYRRQSNAKDFGKALAKNRSNLDVNVCPRGLADVIFPSAELLEMAREDYFKSADLKVPTISTGQSPSSKITLKGK